ncbi:ATP-binding protein [Streptomyces sp. NPDC052101]|uniref:AlbA family DNA-binding domain-containing protein n=1 Tax=Streptomyces sp. NPDC052101 TaxID=3155763 RepID=UPI003447B6B2
MGFLNGEGGNLYIGVADDGTVLGIENDLTFPAATGHAVMRFEVEQLSMQVRSCCRTRRTSAALPAAQSRHSPCMSVPDAFGRIPSSCGVYPMTHHVECVAILAPATKGS